MEICDFEIAKKLKEKGFKEKCFRHYYPNGRDWFTTYYIECGDNNNVDAPTISQVLKWLREQENIFVEIALYPEGYRHIIYIGVYRTDTSNASYFSFDGFYNNENNYMTYEQAALAGIKYVLDNLI